MFASCSTVFNDKRALLAMTVNYSVAHVPLLNVRDSVKQMKRMHANIERPEKTINYWSPIKDQKMRNGRDYPAMHSVANEKSARRADRKNATHYPRICSKCCETIQTQTLSWMTLGWYDTRMRVAWRLSVGLRTTSTNQVNVQPRRPPTK